MSRWERLAAQRPGCEVTNRGAAMALFHCSTSSTKAEGDKAASEALLGLLQGAAAAGILDVLLLLLQVLLLAWVVWMKLHSCAPLHLATTV